MGRRIVITGGGTGIGKASAHRFLAEQPSLVLIGRRLAVLEEAAAELVEEDPDLDISVYDCDLADPEAVGELAGTLCRGRPIDVLVCNAGGNYGLGAGPDLAEISQAWWSDFAGNVLSAVLITEALRDQLARPGGRVIAVSSIAALRGSGSYGAAKAAVNAWVLSLASELAKDQITVNAVAPGFVPDTDFWRPRIAADPDIWESRIKPIPMRRPGTPEEIAEGIAYLASPLAGWTTGQILQINGGTLLGRG